MDMILEYIAIFEKSKKHKTSRPKANLPKLKQS
jgi:hypothetical protein